MTRAISDEADATGDDGGTAAPPAEWQPTAARRARRARTSAESSGPTTPPPLLGQMAHAVAPRAGRRRTRHVWELLWCGVWAQPWGILSALVSTYMGLFIAVDLATGGAVVGLLLQLFHLVPLPDFNLGTVVTTGHITTSWSTPYANGVTHAVHLVSLPGAALGGAVAAVIAFYTIPLVTIGGMTVLESDISALIAGFIVALVLTSVIIAGERRVWLRLRGYRQMSVEEKKRIDPLLEGAATALGIDSVLPVVMISDQPRPAVWAHCTAIVLTHGMLTTFPPDDGEGNQALAGVLAHELAHWRAGHTVGQQLVWASAWPLALLYNAGVILWRVGRIQVICLVAYAIIWPAWVLTKLFIAPTQAWRTRRHEYEADGAARDAGAAYCAGLRRALETMSAFETGRTGWESGLADTQPATALRRDQLRSTATEERA